MGAVHQEIKWLDRENRGNSSRVRSPESGLNNLLRGPMAALDGARFLAYRLDMSASLRAVCLALGPLTTVIQTAPEIVLAKFDHLDSITGKPKIGARCAQYDDLPSAQIGQNLRADAGGAPGLRRRRLGRLAQQATQLRRWV